jgi:hypothetical protein
MSTFDEEAFKIDLVQRAVKDPAFRAALLADPKGTLEVALGNPLPESVTVEVLQEVPEKVYLVLPLAVGEADAAPGKNQPLDDEALEQIAGGSAQAAHDYRFDGTLNRALNRRRQ